MIQLARALAISRKDVESYYGKPPLVTWGLLFPAVLILAVYIKDRAGYLDVAPGIIAMTLLFGNTSMAAIVITFEKRSGTFERLLLSPLGMGTIILGKALSAAAYGIATSIVLAVGLKACMGLPMARPDVFIAGLLIGSCVFSLLGLIASVMVKEVFEAMTLMNFFRFPLLFLSGVFVPFAQMPGWLKPVAWLSPLTHAGEMIRFGIFGETAFASPWVPVAASLIMFAAVCVLSGLSFQRYARR
ncbi:MAG TPA: ABC transporter permease [Candidatus Brocadiia bacterium]|nr:ABC transporter permease [Candidatus Brocadiia bacterium]